MDETAIRDALAEHHTSSFGWSLHCCRGDPVEAEEVLQAVYLLVLEGKARFGGRATFRTWLFSVIRNVAADRRRRRALRAALLLRRRDELPHPNVPPAADELADRIPEHCRLREALDRLPRRQRELLLLVFYHELTIEQAGRVLGISLGSARTHYHRGKLRLRRELTEDARDTADVRA